jgi:hypothetical protein
VAAVFADAAASAFGCAYRRLQGGFLISPEVIFLVEFFFARNGGKV